MEIALQGQSKGIYYEGYDKAFIQCIFEEGEVQGRNERYEFRCNSDLECCGRVCCVPQEATVPLWLMIIFIILALLLLLAILGTLAWLCAKRPKKGNGYLSGNLKNSDTRGSGYASLKQGKDGVQLVNEQDTYSTPEPLYGGGRDGYDSGYAAGYRAGFGTLGYGNRGYGDSNGSQNGQNGLSQRVRDVAVIEGPPKGGDRRGSTDSRDSVVSNHHIHETYEESYRQEVQYERPVSHSSNEML